MDAMLETATEVSELMKSLGNPKRLLILCQLVEGEKSVSELARLTAMKEPAVSQQLALLRKDGIVAPRRDGQNVLYDLVRKDVRQLIEFLYATYCQPSCDTA
ncbi:ArsR family transcriptional regulator [Dongia mobilis]|uniref:ArsR family transcriptional regulator n=1 Tax=Dongia mobilis TaxID=578943 RepID=A0A4R6WWW9_9PROT|nr:metalloregulator ArsR/SmtB family transcription factor [Dongia mobilis]TDQ85506.1 ArsR family transcriptional regulator [Dongia mobilis]